MGQIKTLLIKKVISLHKVSFGTSLLIFILTIAFLLQTIKIQNRITQAQVASFTFTAAGDHGTGTDTTASLNQIGSSAVNFHLALGDLSYNGPGSEPAWCQLVKDQINQGAGRPPGDPYGENFPFELVSGNHEDGGGSDGDINNFAACLPDRIGGLTGSYAKEYYFDYQALARIIMIAPDLTLDGQLYSYNIGSLHYNFVRDAIDGARSAGIPWVIVGMHKVCITMGGKSCEIGSDLFNLLIEKRVDLILQGHDHNYQRGKQLAINASCTSIPVGTYNASCVIDDGADNNYLKGSGSVLVINGTFGAGISDVSTSDAEASYFASWMGNNLNPSNGNLRVNVTSTQLTANFTPSIGSFSDGFTITESGAPTPTPTPTPAGYVQRVDLGSTSSFTDPTSQVWSGDRAYSSGSFGYTGSGSIYTYSTTSSIANTTSDTLYQTTRRSSSTWGYRFDVPNGTYNVRLLFAEIYQPSMRVGGRVGDYSIEGSLLLDNFDVYVAAGNVGNSAVDRTFSATVADGSLNIDIVPVVSGPVINAIEVVQL